MSAYRQRQPVELHVHPSLYWLHIDYIGTRRHAGGAAQQARRSARPDLDSNLWLVHRSLRHTRLEGGQGLARRAGIMRFLGLQVLAAHASVRTTQLYDRRRDDVTLDEVVKINICG